MATLLRLGHTVVQGQTVTCCECGSVVAHLCRVSMAYRWLLHERFAPRTSNINAQSCSNFRISYPTVSKNHCWSTRLVLFVCGCGWASLPVCINDTGSAAFKHFDPLVHTSLWQTVLSILGSQLSMNLCTFHSFRHQTNTLLHVSCPWYKPVVEQSSLRHAHSAQADYS
jgi:hypothetical protein